ncbi:PUA domain-containing protein [Ordospora colligata]|uniref:PUA domain-containing protein n=1 Tax=Ordospora colligata OC4 TaxID=1354746 RepID=A0A0B2UKQ7_9MICR|nr:PUA domain-containing protein [Ordospora colligata OC4]KHN69789.1 PUA domain-containing protein [Ordospora colligata OC4]TBU15592.1 PUA domain-containing protein [Ordospora colligata]TBU15659.1 PUA domain-containing protein [Ordospora colligata]TBU18710.1 PUA domain-containing protein [Ordospora colligata]
MKGLFSKMEISSSCCLGKKEKKDINKHIDQELLSKDESYMVYKSKKKVALIALGKNTILFCLNKKYFPTIRYLEEKGTEGFIDVFLDEGAVGPLSRGADVMIPGVMKCKELLKCKFKKGDVVVINIIGKSIVAVGEAIIDFDEMNEKGMGVCIEVYHRIGDELYEEKYM